MKKHFLSIIKKLIDSKSADENKARQEYILNILLLGTIFLISLGFLIIVFRLMAPHPLEYERKSLPLISVLINLLFFSGLYLLSKRGHGRLSAHIFVFLIFSLAFYQGFIWGVDLPASLLFYVLAIVISGIILGAKNSFITTGLTFLTISFSAYFQKNNIISSDRSWISDLWGESDVLMATVILLIIATVSWLFNRELNKSLKKLQKSERALKIERDLLEYRVEEKTKELRVKQAKEIAQVYRFAEIGKLSSGLFHDLANPLTSVMLNIHKIKLDGQNNPSFNLIETELNQAIKASEKMKAFMSSVRKQIRLESKSEDFSLNKELEEALCILNYKIKKSQIQIDFNASENIIINNDPIKFNQIITNIITNAIEAYDDSLKTEKIIKISLEKRQHLIIIEIADNGVGIKRENLSRLFEPFFSTKGNSDNLGLGLSLVKKIIEESFKGKIELTSELNKGTKFIITIPARQNELPSKNN